MTIEEQRLPGTDYAALKFTGMGAEVLETPHLRDEMTFKVIGTVVLVGEEIVNGVVRQVAKLKVTSVVPA